MEPADSTGVAPLRERVWSVLRNATLSTAQRTALILLLGVSGAGKTKTAFDIGRKYALLIFARVHEKGPICSLTRPWELLVAVLKALHSQLHIASRTAAAAGLAPNPDKAAPESITAVACILVLLACHVEWVAMVCAAAARELSLFASADDADGAAHMDAAMREVAVRAQRNGTAFDNVHDLFCLRLLGLIESGGVALEPGQASLTIDVAMRNLARAEALLPRSMVTRGAELLPTFVCIDEVGALLDHTSLDGLFKGTFMADSSAPSRVPESAVWRPTAPRTGPNGFPALAGDVIACRLFAQRKPVQGLLYGLLVATRLVMNKHPWGHLLCGTNLRLDAALLSAHSPAQGVSVCMDADTHLDVPALRRWLAYYLTTDAMAGVDDALLSQLVGRPLYASFFWLQVQGGLSPSGAPVALHFDAAAFVREALESAIRVAGIEADGRISALWSSTFEIRRLGSRPSLLLAWLYFLQRMGWGSETSFSPPSCSAEVMDAVSRGVLHLRRDQHTFNLSDEPVTMQSILRVGDRETSECPQSDDLVMCALARRVTGLFGDAAAKGGAAEDVMAWALLRSSLRRRISLRDLLDPFLSPLARELFPASLAEYTVCLTSGLHCRTALGKSSPFRCFLDLLSQPGGESLLLHHTQETAAGADLVCVAMGPRSPGGTQILRPVLIQLRNKVKSTLADALSTVDLGSWYPDTDTSVAHGETRSHFAFRNLIHSNHCWAHPIRVVSTARPVADSAVLDLAWVNAALAPQQPLLLLHFSYENTGANILQGQATSIMHSPKNAMCWLPTPLRHWPNVVAHPQMYLFPSPAAPAIHHFTTPTRVVCFSADTHLSVADVIPLARNYGACLQLETRTLPLVVARSTRSATAAAAATQTITVMYFSYPSAITAVSAARVGNIVLGTGVRISAWFSPESLEDDTVGELSRSTLHPIPFSQQMHATGSSFAGKWGNDSIMSERAPIVSSSASNSPVSKPSAVTVVASRQEQRRHQTRACSLREQRELLTQRTPHLQHLAHRQGASPPGDVHSLYSAVYGSGSYPARVTPDTSIGGKTLSVSLTTAAAASRHFSTIATGATSSPSRAVGARLGGLSRVFASTAPVVAPMLQHHEQQQQLRQLRFAHQSLQQSPPAVWASGIISVSEASPHPVNRLPPDIVPPVLLAHLPDHAQPEAAFRWRHLLPSSHDVSVDELPLQQQLRISVPDVMCWRPRLRSAAASSAHVSSIRNPVLEQPSRIPGTVGGEMQRGRAPVTGRPLASRMLRQQFPMGGSGWALQPPVSVSSRTPYVPFEEDGALGHPSSYSAELGRGDTGATRVNDDLDGGFTRRGKTSACIVTPLSSGTSRNAVRSNLALDRSLLFPDETEAAWAKGSSDAEFISAHLAGGGAAPET